MSGVVGRLLTSNTITSCSHAKTLNHVTSSGGGGGSISSSRLTSNGATAAVAAGGGGKSRRERQPDEVLMGAAAWACEHIAKHGKETADGLAMEGALQVLVNAYTW